MATSSSTSKVQACIVEAPPSNVGNMYIGDSVANILAGNRHVIRPGEAYEFNVDDNSSDDNYVFLDLSEVFFDGANAGDVLVVTSLQEKSVNY